MQTSSLSDTNAVAVHALPPMRAMLVASHAMPEPSTAALRIHRFGVIFLPPSSPLDSTGLHKWWPERDKPPYA